MLSSFLFFSTFFFALVFSLILVVNVADAMAFKRNTSVLALVLAVAALWTTFLYQAL